MGGAGLGSMISQGVSSEMSAMGAVQKSRYSANLAERNAAIARQNASDANLRGQVEAERLTMEGGRTIGKQRAAAGASGVDVQSGSILDVISGTRFLNKMDVEKAQYGAALESRGFMGQATDFESEAQMARLEGAYAEMSSPILGTGRLLGIDLPSFGK